MRVGALDRVGLCRCGDRLERNHRRGGHGRPSGADRVARHCPGAACSPRCGAGDRPPFEPYHVEIRGAKGSRSAAAAAAAHDVLVGLYEAQAGSLDASYHDYLANNGLTGDSGIEVGQKVGCRVSAVAAGESGSGCLLRLWEVPIPALAPNRFLPWHAAGPPGAVLADFAPWLGTMDPFTLTSPRRFRAPPPPALTSERYQRDYDEVKALGALVGSTSHAGSDRHRLLLQRQLLRAVEPCVTRDLVAACASHRRQRAPVRARERGDSRCGHHGLGQQEALRLLATADGHPRR